MREMVHATLLRAGGQSSKQSSTPGAFLEKYPLDYNIIFNSEKLQDPVKLFSAPVRSVTPKETSKPFVFRNDQIIDNNLFQIPNARVRKNEILKKTKYQNKSSAQGIKCKHSDP